MNITITEEEYNKLRDKARWLECLNAAGVDNWEWYDLAQDIYNEEENK